MAGMFDDIKKKGDFLNAKEDWNKAAQYLNSLMKMSSSNLNVSMGLNACSIELPNGMRASELRLAKLTGAGTLNSGTGTYKAEELFLDKTDINAWLWDIRADDHLKWDTEDIGNSTTITTVIDDLYEINGTSGIENDTVVVAMKVDRLVNDKDNLTNYQWIFMIGGGGGGGYDGPYKVTYDAVLDKIVVGAGRTVNFPDIIVAGQETHQYADPELVDVPTTSSKQWLYYEVTADADFVVTTSVVYRASIQAQGNEEIAFPVATIKRSDGPAPYSYTIEQTQFGNVFVWNRTGGGTV